MTDETQPVKRGRGRPKGPNLANREMAKAAYAVFLKELGLDGNVTRSAHVAGIERRAIYERRKNDPEFEKQWADAFERATDTLEAEARRRGLEGYDEPVFYQGVEMARVRRFSDPLLIMLLKGNRRKYATNATEISNAPGETFKVESTPTADARKIAFMMELGARAIANETDDT